MSKTAQGYWEDIFIRYQSSGQSHPAFCRENNLSHNQFHYRWDEHNKALKGQTSHLKFESVSLIPQEIRALPEATLSVKIHLPNQIRCDVGLDFKEILSRLIKLVQPCGRSTYIQRGS